MFRMQTNDSRLIKAAKRTIRAEVTLVIVILIITSWSVYALYKLTIDGSSNIYGRTFTNASNLKPTANLADVNDLKKVIGIKQATDELFKYQQQSAQTLAKTDNYKVQPNEIKYKILQELLASQRDFYNSNRNLGAALSDLPSHLISAAAHEQLRPPQARTSSSSSLSLDGQKRTIQSMPLNRLNNLLGDQRQQQLLDPKSRPSNQFSRSIDSEGLNQGSKLLPIPAIVQSTDSSLNKQQEGLNNTLVAIEEANSASGSRDDDYDRNQKSPDGTTDREVAASDEYPSEMPVDSTDNSTSNDSNADGDDATEEILAQDEENRDDSQSAPSQDSDEQPAVVSGSNPQSDEGTSNTDEPNSDQVLGGTGDEVNDSTLKEEGHTVDETVDGMVQPSAGALNHKGGEDKQSSILPFDYKNIVQFDDLLGGTVGSVASSSNRQLSMKSMVPGDLIARFATPQSGGKKDTKLRDMEQKGRQPTRELDLQVDHNRPVVSSGSKVNLRNSTFHISAKPEFEERKKSLKSSQLATSSQNDQTNAGPVETEKLNLSTNRRKRSFKKLDSIRAPYEIDNFLSSLNFDVLIGQSTSRASIRRYPRSVETTGPDEVEGGLATPKYHYLTSNDTNLQELLAQKDLLEALKQGQLAAPSVSSSGITTPKPVAINENQQQQRPQDEVAEVGVEANSLVPDNGGDKEESVAINTAASGEKRESMSMKKKKKHEIKEHKKKMAAGSKKGGHKKKKHKKEIKKFVKEKKFKGAKKGKKEAKGKGGQGGKKGKKLYKDKGFKKRGFKNIYHKEEFGQKKSYFDEFRDKDFKKKWKKFDDKYNYAQMKKWQAKDVKGAKKVKDHEEKYKKYDKSQWKKKYQKQSKEHKASSKKKKKTHEFE